MTEPVFARLVDKFIGEFRSAPLIPDFREVISAAREKAVQREKEKFSQDSREFWAGTYHNDEVKQIVATIKRRLEGKCSDEEWASHLELLRRSAKPEKFYCAQCKDTGIVLAEMDIDGVPYSFRCQSCKTADNFRISIHIPAWRRQSGFTALN